MHYSLPHECSLFHFLTWKILHSYFIAWLFVSFIKKFLISNVVMFQDGNLKPFIKSEPIPETNNEPVKVVVAESLHDMVFNSGKNGLSLTLY